MKIRHNVVYVKFLHATSFQNSKILSEKAQVYDRLSLDIQVLAGLNSGIILQQFPEHSVRLLHVGANVGAIQKLIKRVMMQSKIFNQIFRGFQNLRYKKRCLLYLL